MSDSVMKRIWRLEAALNLCADAFERMGEMSAQGKLDSDVWYACVKARTAIQSVLNEGKA